MHQQTARYNGPYGLLNRGTERSDGATSGIYWESVNKWFSVPAMYNNYKILHWDKSDVCETNGKNR